MHPSIHLSIHQEEDVLPPLSSLGARQLVRLSGESSLHQLSSPFIYAASLSASVGLNTFFIVAIACLIIQLSNQRIAFFGLQRV